MQVKIKQSGETLKSILPNRKHVETFAEVPFNWLYILGKYAMSGNARTFFCVQLSDGSVARMVLSEQSHDVQKVLAPLFKQVPPPIPSRGGFDLKWGFSIPHPESD